MKPKPAWKPDKHFVIYAVTLIGAILFLVIGNRVASQGRDTIFGAEQEGAFWRARVLEIVREENSGYEIEGAEDAFTMTTITFEARALSGPRKGDTIRCMQQQDDMFAMLIPKAESGDVVLIDVMATEEGGEVYLMYDFVRTTPLVWLAVLFAVLVLLFARKKGFNTLLSFAISLMAIFLVLVPAVLNGLNIYFWSLLICFYIVVTNLLLVQGASAKSLTAALGCFGGVACSGLLMAIMNGPMHITGLLDEESIQLSYLESGINVKATIFCMILIGSVGALMDVTMDIAAALHELRENNPALPARELMRSGLNIGKDLIGTMANTLVLAYIGGSLGSLLVMITYSTGITQMINREMIAVEILQALIGCLSVLAVVPLTAFICSVFYRPTAAPEAAAADEAEHEDDTEE